MDKPVTVLLADDHEVVRKGLRASLDARGKFTVVGEAASGTEAVRLASEYVPDLDGFDYAWHGRHGSNPAGEKQ